MHCGTGTAPNGLQHILLALHSTTVGTFGTATGNDHQVLEKLYLDGVFLTQFGSINPSETLLPHLSLYTHDFRVLQAGTVQVESSGFHFEHSSICSEIQALLLLWERV